MGEKRLSVTMIRLPMIRALLLGLVLALPATASGAQEWLLNAGASHFYMQTAKANAIIEIHQFSGLEGSVSKEGDAEVKVDLTSVASGIDVRDVRMRFLLFETYKFPSAVVKAKIDMGKLQQAASGTRITYPLAFSLDLHGMKQELEATVTVTRVGEKSVSVASAKPIVVSAEDFGLGPGIQKLSEAVNGTPIVRAVSITFDLVFETGEKIPEIQASYSEAAKRKKAEETGAISSQACETRFSVISTTGAIYFRTGSAELDTKSEPLLKSVADIANRCPSVKIEITGHTDSVGSKDANQHLSAERAQSVAKFLVQQGVASPRIDTAGLGDTRPVAPNDSDANRAKNRRIEFRVKGV
jgi:outer membrane protein OmpA-like peptidoglycan-associated protein